MAIIHCVMPRKNPVPEFQVAICRRLRRFRRDTTKLSRVAFAGELGIDGTQLANYEHARAPIRCGLFKRVYSKFGLNPAWLAEEKGEPQDHNALPDGALDDLPDEMLFSAAYVGALKHVVQNWGGLLDEIKAECAEVLQGARDPVMAYQAIMVALDADFLGALSPKLSRLFWIGLGDYAERFRREHAEEIKAARKAK